MIYAGDEFYGDDVTSGLAEVWCAECEKPSLADFTIKGETVALCIEHIAARFPSELTESEMRLMDGNR